MNAIVSVASNAEAYRASTDAAELCREIVVATASNIQGKKYVGVEGWQAIAIAHGCAAGSRDVERVEGGVRAVGEVRRMCDGIVIATAEGFVGEDEPTWFGGVSRGKTLPKRADYAIRAMAQTRAISRACRSAFAHVVVMMKAGLATTPAEEVPFGGFDNGEVIDVQPESEPIKGIHKIKERLRTMMTAGADTSMTLEKFKELQNQNKADLLAIRDANHSWWTGDGEDFEGFGPWIQRRRAELNPDDMVNRAIMDMKETVSSVDKLAAWRDTNSAYLEKLDGEESRRFQSAYDEFEAGLAAVAAVNAG